MPTVNNTSIAFIVLQPYSIAEKDSTHNNRPQKNSTYPQVENITILHKHLFSLKNTTSCLLKRQRHCSIRVGSFPRRVSMVIFIYNQKSFVRRRLRRCRLRHKIPAIKTRPSNPLHFLQRKNSIRRYSANDLTCAARKTTFRTQKRFHNKQYTPKSKDQPFESDRTHFDTVFNNGSIAMHRQTFILLLSHKITTVQKKQQTGTINHDKLSHQSIAKTTHTISQSKTPSKQTIKTNTTTHHAIHQDF